MIGIPAVGNLQGVVISGSGCFGPSVTTTDGKPLRVTLVDSDGKVVAAGDEVVWEIWNVAIESYRQMLMGLGYLKVYSENPAKHLAG